MKITRRAILSSLSASLVSTSWTADKTTYGGGTLKSRAMGPSPRTKHRDIGQDWQLVENATFGPRNPEGPTVVNRREMMKHFATIPYNSKAWISGTHHRPNANPSGTTWSKGNVAFWYTESALSLATCPEDTEPANYLVYDGTKLPPAHDFSYDPTCLTLMCRLFPGREPEPVPRGLACGYTGTLFGKINYPNPMNSGHDMLWEMRLRLMPSAAHSEIPYGFVGIDQFNVDQAHGNGECDWLEWMGQDFGEGTMFDTRHNYTNAWNAKQIFEDPDLRNWFVYAIFVRKDGRWMVYFDDRPKSEGVVDREKWSNTMEPQYFVTWGNPGVSSANGRRDYMMPPGVSGKRTIDKSYFPWGMQIAYSRFYLR